MKKNKKKDENKNKTIISIVIVALIIVIIASGTYAYWTWISADEDDTSVSITVQGMTMILDGGGDINAENLIPTTCGNINYATHTTITYSVTNPTQIDSTATIQLKASTFPTQLKNSKLMWKLTTGANCTGTEVASGDFGSTTKGDTIDLTNKVGTTKEDGTTYYVPAGTTDATALTGTYYLSIWLDSSYTGTTNVGYDDEDGDGVDDDIENTIQEKGMTLQLTGTIAQNPS